MHLPVIFLSTATIMAMDITVDKTLNVFSDRIEEIISISGIVNELPLHKKLNFQIKDSAFSHLKRMEYYVEGIPGSVFKDIEKESLFEISFPNTLVLGDPYSTTVRLYYTNRFVFKPYRIKINQDQIIHFEDTICPLIFADGVRVSEVLIKYTFPTKLSAGEGLLADVKPDELNGRYVYRIAKTDSCGSESVKAVFVSNSSVARFSKVERTISVSFWGDIQDTSEFDLVNDGAPLDGEYSTIDFMAASRAGRTNAIEFIDTFAEGGVKQIAMHDEVGRLTRPALQKTADGFALRLIPRFPVLGGWKSSFVIDLRYDVGRYLYWDRKDRNIMKVTDEISYLFKNVFAEKYKLNVCLPSGSVLQEHKMKYDFTRHEIYHRAHLLDYFGQICHSFSLDNFIPQAMNENFEVVFRTRSWKMWTGGLYLFLLIMCTSVLSLVVSKIDWSFSQRSNPAISK